jgi:hypothetical protein
MSYRIIASIAAAALIGIACVSTDALARGGRGAVAAEAASTMQAGSTMQAAIVVSIMAEPMCARASAQPP